MNYIYSFPVEEQLKYIQGQPYKCEFFHPGYTCETQLLHIFSNKFIYIEISSIIQQILLKIIYCIIFRFPVLFYESSKVYLPVHLLPLLIYKRKAFVQNPIRTTARTLLSFLKSVLFVTFMVEIFRYNCCKQIRFRNIVDSFTPIPGGFIGGLFLYLESENRAQEIMLNVVPRYFETIFNLLKRKGWLKNIPKGDVLVFAIILAIIHYYYQHDQNALKTTYRGVFSKFWGKN